MNDVVILAGGKGTRLRTILNDTPKCLVSVDGTPFLCNQIAQFFHGGASRIILALALHAEKIFDVVTNYFPSECLERRIIFDICDEAQGTALAVCNAVKYVETSDFIVANADTIILSLHENLFTPLDQTYFAEIYAAWMSDSRHKYLRLDGEHITGYQDFGPGFVSSGLIKISQKRFFEYVDNSKLNLKNRNVEDTVIYDWVSAEKVKVTEIEEFLDFGVPSDYRKIRAFIKC